MNAPEDEKLIATHDERLMRMMAQAHASSLLQLDAVKVRISHHEKLVGLCAGTLALSFTAATAFHGQHTQQAEALQSLFHAWQYLLAAIVMSVLSNWLSVNGLSNLGNSLGRKQIDVYFSLLEPVLAKLSPAYAKTEREAWDNDSKKSIRSGKTGDVLIRLAAVVGILAQIAAFCGFVSLYYFAKDVLAG
jgi:hypothetical protein